MNSFSLLTGIVVATFSNAALLGQSPSPDAHRGAPHIALVDVNKAVRNFKEYKDREKGIQDSVETAKKNAAAMEEELSVLQKKLTELSTAAKSIPKNTPKRKAADEAVEKKSAELQIKAEQLSNFREGTSTTLTNNLRSQAIQAANTVIEFVTSYAAEKGFTIVINVPTPNDKEPEARIASDVIVGLGKLREEAKDITDDVIHALEKR